MSAGGWAVVGAIGAAAALAVLRRRFLVVRVEGLSMQPALSEGARVLVRRCPADRVRRDDVVVLDAPPAGTRMIKRVVGLPGDPVSDGAVPPETAARTVPAGRLLVLGDNAARSLDSRQFGFLDATALVGVMVRQLSRP